MAFSTLRLFLVAFIFCQSGQSHALESDKEPDLRGLYVMKISIGDRIFEDIVNLQNRTGKPITPFEFRTELVGFLTVESVFTSALSGRIHCQTWDGHCSLSFEITALENGKEFKVFYRARIDGINYHNVTSGQPAILVGEAFLESGELLGKFTAHQQL